MTGGKTSFAQSGCSRADHLDKALALVLGPKWGRTVGHALSAVHGRWREVSGREEAALLDSELFC